MEKEYSLAPLLFVLGALLVGALLKLMLKKSKFPYTVGLFCLGTRNSCGYVCLCPSEGCLWCCFCLGESKRNSIARLSALNWR